MTAERTFVLSAKEVARLVRADRTASWFYANRKALEIAGFPKKDRLLGGWSRAAIEHWLAKRDGTVAQSVDDQERQTMREAINARKAQRHAIRHQPAG